MKDITTFISPLVESQFPSFYREDGLQFITLIKSYYEWLEQSNNALYHARRLLEYRDIDQTVDDFIVYFKEETLKNIQFDVATNKRLLTKNALDFYRSKGTARSVDLFFKLVYAQPAKVYYPGDDVFKLSDNTWKIPEYLEVTNTVYNPDFEGKQVTGIRSGATAFVENYAIKKKINNQVDAEGNEVKIAKDIHVFYITNVRGNFEFGETIVHSGTDDPRKAPKLIGSLTELQVITGASDYVVGDIVNLISNTGFNGKALVTSIANTTGQVEFTLIDGGWGYTTSPKIIISEKALLVNNVIASSGSLSKPFKLFSTLVQPKAYIEFDTLTGTLEANNLLFSYESDNVTSISKIITISSNTDGTGNMYLSIISGTLPGTDNILYLNGNVSSANITLKVDRTSTANIMGVSSNNILLIDDVQGGLLPIKGEEIYQQNSSIGEWVTATVNLVRQEGGKNLVYVTNTVGSFISSQRIRGRASGSNSNLSSYSTTIGIFNPSETSVISVNIQSKGQGYSNGELVTFGSETGSGAVGLVVTYANSSVSSINILNGGSGYITSPSVKIVNTASPVYFNSNTDVDPVLDFISIPNNGFINAQAIRYTANTGNTPLSGLVSGFVYYARLANNRGIQLSDSPSGAVIQLSKSVTENGHSFTAAVSSGNSFSGNAVLGSPFDYGNKLYVYSVGSNLVSFNASNDVNATNHFISLNNNPFTNGQALVYRVGSGRTNLDLLSNNSVYYVGVANSTGIDIAYSNGTIIPISPGVNENGHSFAAYTEANIDLAGEGSLADIRISSLDDEETLRLNTDFIGGYNIYGAPYSNIFLNGNSNSALSGSNAYGFPGKPSGNLTNYSIETILTKELFTIGTISAIGAVNPGDDYTLDPFVTIIEPVVAGYRKYDQIMTIDGDTARMTRNENILISNRKAFDGSSANVVSSFIYMNDHPFVNDQPVVYSTKTGSSLVGGLANNTTYYVVEANNAGFSVSLTKNGAKIILTPTPSTSFQYIESGNYEKFGLLKEIIDTNTIKVRRLTFINEADPNSETYLKGETSQYVTRLMDSKNDETYSGLNSLVEANVITANGVVKTLKVIDSGFAYEQSDVMSFQNEDDPESTIGLAKGSNIKQGVGSGFYQNTKGFLSRDKYLHDNDFYQDYSYQIISRVPFERYSNMLKKVLHVSGTKMFPAVEIESKNQTPIGAADGIKIRFTFNPSIANAIDIDENFITIPNHILVNGDMITYSVDDGNTAIKTTTPINGIKTISIINPGSYYDSTVNNQIIITGSDGSGTIATFTNNSSGNIISVQVYSYGTGYTSTISPTITAGVANELSSGATFEVSSYTGLGNNVNYYVASANSTGFKLSLTPDGSTIVNFVAPLPNETGHGLERDYISIAIGDIEYNTLFQFYGISSLPVIDTGTIASCTTYEICKVNEFRYVIPETLYEFDNTNIDLETDYVTIGTNDFGVDQDVRYVYTSSDPSYEISDLLTRSSYRVSDFTSTSVLLKQVNYDNDSGEDVDFTSINSDADNATHYLYSVPLDSWRWASTPPLNFEQIAIPSPISDIIKNYPVSVKITGVPIVPILLKSFGFNNNLTSNFLYPDGLLAQFTFEAWIQMLSYPGDTSNLGIYDDPNDYINNKFTIISLQNNFYDKTVSLVMNSLGNLQLKLQDQYNELYETFNFNEEPVPLDEWTHIALVKNDQQVKLFINGNLLNTVNINQDIFFKEENQDFPLIVYVATEVNEGNQENPGTVDARLDSIRLIDAVLYTNNFTPPSNFVT